MDARNRILKKYVSADGRCGFDEWLEGLKDKRTQAVVTSRLNRLIQGNFGDCKALGGGLWELRINFGPGFRVYFSERDQVIVLLLCGGSKRTQQRDIWTARKLLEDFVKEEE